MLGLAMRAGKVAVGTDAVIDTLRQKKNKKARVVLISNTASDSTRSKIVYKCEYYRVSPIIVDISASELGEILGKLYAPSAVAITDDSFAAEIVRIISEG